MPFNPLVLLVALPLLTGIVSVPLVQRLRLSRGIGILSQVVTLSFAIGLLLWAQGDAGTDVGGVLVSQMGGWAAPFGISLIHDALSGLLICSTALVVLAGYLCGIEMLSPVAERRYYHPLIHFLHAGVNLSFLTGDLFNLFVAFEIMLMSSYGLLCLGGNRSALTQAYKYVLLNLLASTVFVIGAGMTYGMMGTLNMAHLMQLSQQQDALGLAAPIGFTALGILLLLVFALKGAVFPLWSWLPDAYPTCPIPVLAIFGGVLTKVGVYAIARLYPAVFDAGDNGAVIAPLLAVASAATMLGAALIAITQKRLRLSLSMMVVAGVGYAVLGIAVGSPDAFAGSVFYMTQSMIVAALGFLLCGLIEARTGTDGYNRLGGLYRGHPWLAAAVFIAALTLVGLPPLSGFYGKLLVIREALLPTGDAGTGLAPGRQIWWAGLAGILAGALALLAMLHAWTQIFWLKAEHPDDDLTTARSQSRLSPLRPAVAAPALLLVATLFLSLFPQPVLAIAHTAGRQLHDPTPYINAVMQAPPEVARHEAEGVGH